MVHTVGLMGANGLVGEATAKALAQSAKDGKIKLVLFHREGKVPSGFDDDVEMRILDLEGELSSIEATVRGVNVFISALGFGALPSEPKLVDALARSPDFVTYIPSTYSTTWTDADKADPPLGDIITFIHSGWDRALEKKVGVTAVYTGVFDVYWFEYEFVGSSIKKNLVWANESQMKNRVPITVIDHLADVLNELATSDPQAIKNTEHSVVTLWPTGREIANVYQKINSKSANIKDFTAQDREEFRADAANFGAAKVGYWDKWEKNDWGYEQDGKISHNTDSFPLESIARRFA